MHVGVDMTVKEKGEEDLPIALEANIHSLLVLSINLIGLPIKLLSAYIRQAHIYFTPLLPPLPPLYWLGEF